MSLRNLLVNYPEYWKAIGAGSWAIIATIAIWLHFPLYPGVETALITLFSLFGPPLTVYYFPGNKPKVDNNG